MPDNRTYDINLSRFTNWAFIMPAVLLAALLSVILFSSIVFIPAGHEGVKFNVISGHIAPTTLKQGWQFRIPMTPKSWSMIAAARTTPWPLHGRNPKIGLRPTPIGALRLMEIPSA